MMMPAEAFERLAAAYFRVHACNHACFKIHDRRAALFFSLTKTRAALRAVLYTPRPSRPGFLVCCGTIEGQPNRPEWSPWPLFSGPVAHV